MKSIFDVGIWPVRVVTNLPLAKQITALSKALPHIQLYHFWGLFQHLNYKESFKEKLILIYISVHIFIDSVVFVKPNSIATNIMLLTYQTTLKYTLTAHSLGTSCLIFLEIKTEYKEGTTKLIWYPTLNQINYSCNILCQFTVYCKWCISIEINNNHLILNENTCR